MKLWKKVKKKEQFLSSPNCAAWLEADVISHRPMTECEPTIPQEKTPIQSQSANDCFAGSNPTKTPYIPKHL
jgi:hypothetical protein